MSAQKSDLYDPRFAELAVLVVCESSHLSGLVTKLLHRFGFRDLKIALNGKAAFELLADNFFDIALTDQDMEVAGGIAFAEMVRRNPDSPNPELPIVMMIGSAVRETIFQVRDAGINDIISKPLNAQSLFQKLSSAYDNPRKHITAESFTGPDRRRRRKVDNLSAGERRKSVS